MSISEINCAFYDGVCKSPINKSDLECSLIPTEKCYYKQLQELKAEHEKLQADCNNLKEQNSMMNNLLMRSLLRKETWISKKDMEYLFENEFDDVIVDAMIREKMTELYEAFVENNAPKYIYGDRHPANLDELEECMNAVHTEWTTYKHRLDEIKELARTLGNQNDFKYRLEDDSVQQLLKIDDDLLSGEDILRKHILQIIGSEE